MTLQRPLPGGRTLLWTHQVVRDDDGRCTGDWVGHGHIDGNPIPDHVLEELLRSQHPSDHVGWQIGAA